MITYVAALTVFSAFILADLLVLILTGYVEASCFASAAYGIRS